MNVANRRREHQAFFLIVNVLTTTPKIRSSPDLWKHETDIQPQIVRNRRTCFRRSDCAPSGMAVLQATPIEPKFVFFLLWTAPPRTFPHDIHRACQKNSSESVCTCSLYQRADCCRSRACGPLTIQSSSLSFYLFLKNI